MNKTKSEVKFTCETDFNKLRRIKPWLNADYNWRWVLILSVSTVIAFFVGIFINSIVASNFPVFPKNTTSAEEFVSRFIHLFVVLAPTIAIAFGVNALIHRLIHELYMKFDHTFVDNHVLQRFCKNEGILIKSLYEDEKYRDFKFVEKILNRMISMSENELFEIKNGVFENSYGEELKVFKSHNSLIFKN